MIQLISPPPCCSDWSQTNKTGTAGVLTACTSALQPRSAGQLLRLEDTATLSRRKYVQTEHGADLEILKVQWTDFKRWKPSKDRYLRSPAASSFFCDKNSFDRPSSSCNKVAVGTDYVPGLCMTDEELRSKMLGMWIPRLSPTLHILAYQPDTPTNSLKVSANQATHRTLSTTHSMIPVQLCLCLFNSPHTRATRPLSSKS